MSFFLLVAAATLLGGCLDSRGADAEPGESALLVAVEEALPANEYLVRRDFAGRVEAARASEIGFARPGQLRDVHVDEGDRVSRGAVLARLDTARLEARLAEARAALDQALSAEVVAARTLLRSEEAAEFDGISAQELDLARNAAASASAAVAASRARVASVEVDIAKSRLIAPYDAVVIARRHDEGQIVGAGQPILHLQELAPAEVRIGLPGELARAFEPGQRVEIDIDGRSVPATLRAILPVRDPATRTVDVIVTLGADSGVVPGDLARLNVARPMAEDGFWLPISALAEGARGLWTAYIAVPLPPGERGRNGATHTLEPRSVEIVHQDTQHVFVRGALAAGDLYALGGLQRIVPNQAVRIRRGALSAAGSGTDGP